MLPKVIAQHPLFPAILLLSILLILLLVAAPLISALPAPTPLSTLIPATQTMVPAPTTTATTTSTATPSPRPTWTIRPSGTPTQSPTPPPTGTQTPVPNLTPARPLTINDRYLLKMWTPAEAARLIDQLQGYPESLVFEDQDRQSAEYNAAFYYATVAQREALLRYPDEPHAVRWQWGMAYNLARSQDEQAGVQYASLVTGALNTRQVNLEALPVWFSRQEPRMILRMASLALSPGYLNSQIVEIIPVLSGAEQAGTTSPGSTSLHGGAYFWLLETPNGFQAHVLDSNFDFTRALRSGYSLGDLTGDGTQEIAIFHSAETERYLFTPPQIWNLAQVPPQSLPFAPDLPFEVGSDYVNRWTILKGNPAVLQFDGTLFPSCPVKLSREYRWTGALLEPGQVQFEINPAPGLLQYCEFSLEHSAIFWGPEATSQLMASLLPSWPPQEDVQGRAYPLDALDEYRYRLGLNEALAGKREEAIRRLTEVAERPMIKASRWIEPSRKFLAAFQSADDLYRACVLVAECDPRPALIRLAAAIPAGEFDQAPGILKGFGVTLRSSGVFDFDGDGEAERWFLVRHRDQQKLEFWILARAPQGLRALFVETTDSADPSPHYHDLKESPKVVQLRQHAGFLMERVPTSGEPYITHVEVEFVPTTYTLDTLNRAERALFSGENSSQVAGLLSSLAEDSSRFNCRNYHICDRYYYVLGLALELSGQSREAIDWYVKLWWEYPDSPYTIMARLKLASLPTRTPPVSQTPTGTSTPDLTATRTLTPTITGTPNPNATATNTNVPYPTDEGYP